MLAEFGPALRRLAGGSRADPAGAMTSRRKIAIALWRAFGAFSRGVSADVRHRVAHNRALTRVWRRGRAETADVAEAEQVIDPAESVESRVARGQRRARLTPPFERCRIVHRQVLTLALEDLSHTEIAVSLGIGRTRWRFRLTLARQALREALGVSS